MKQNGNISVSVMITGVGGQGTLLASRIIGRAALDSGFDAKVSEVHGMSQRGGNVVTFARYSSEKVSSPIIGENGADAILAFELLEGYRALPFLKKGGRLILNTQRISPASVRSGSAAYPENIIEKIRNFGVEPVVTEALELAMEAGSAKAANTVLVGVFAKHSGIPEETWFGAMGKCFPESQLPVNLKAFEAGYKL